MNFTIDIEVISKIESHIEKKIQFCQSISGGDINQAYKIQMEGKYYFLKMNHHPSADSMFKAEIIGLKALTHHMNTPKVIFQNTTEKYAFLLLEWIDSQPFNIVSMEDFGHQLALLHKTQQSHFGLDSDNFIGTIPQSNSKHESWSSFYFHKRIWKMAELIFEKDLCDTSFLKKLEHWQQVIEDEIPVETPSLLHGDLWNGNYIVGANQKTYLIDPAVYCGHREMDIAMSMLFGSFGRAFYMSYQTTYPLENGFMDRINIHQLYPLLVHTYLFGGHYFKKSHEIVSKYS